MLSTRVCTEVLMRRHRRPNEPLSWPFESLDSSKRDGCNCCLTQTCVNAVRAKNGIVPAKTKSKAKPVSFIEPSAIVTIIAQTTISITEAVYQQCEKDKEDETALKTKNGAETGAVCAGFVGCLGLQRAAIQRPVSFENLVHNPRGIRNALLKPSKPCPIFDAINYIALPEFKLQHIHSPEYLTTDSTVLRTAYPSQPKSILRTASTATITATTPIPIPRSTSTTTLTMAGPSRKRSAEHLDDGHTSDGSNKAPRSDSLRSWPNTSTPPRSPRMYAPKQDGEYDEAHKIADGADEEALDEALRANGVIVNGDGSESAMPPGWRRGEGKQRAGARAPAPPTNAGSWETTSSAITESTAGSHSHGQTPYTRAGYAGQAGPSGIRPRNAPRRTGAAATRPSTAGHPTNYQIWVGIANESKETNRHFTVVLRAPPHLADPRGDCTWYHVLGAGFEETNYYRRVVHAPRMHDEPFFHRKLPVGMMPEHKMRLFQHAFRSTPAQPPEFFLIHFLRKLVAAQIIDPWQILDFERMIGEPPAELAHDPDFKPSPEFGPTWTRNLDVEGNVPIFEMEGMDVEEGEK
ncbi:uncharacterized protein DSM5745_07879 [Aspergillus mulundensis]|uniref:Uncharacterized protein n=1 Tax=Aspergillus mulundensis TaxID=1810919 RepID=A0A3D8RF93_9EURO|nr:hypothetical protein DSM5745_07879 [Aspergillus mulundensis]RDW72707.1 hypothetical protein DSM5745_07879 [Aspergillus mulundensis]